MAIAFDTSTNGGFSALTSLTFSHTCTGSNLILFVATEGPVSSVDDITSMTYAGVAMTKAGGVQVPTDRFYGLWYLIAPATGANNVIINFTGTFCSAFSSSYTGVRQSVQPDSVATNTSAGATSLAIPTTTVADNTWLVGSFGEAAAGTYTAGANTTIRQSRPAQGGAIADSNGAQTPPGSYSLAFSTTISTPLGGIVASIAPLGAPLPNNSGFFMLMN